MGLIYMKTSPSGKSYIGQTVQKEETRWKAHINSAYNTNDPRYHCKFSRAIRKYGENNFKTTILENNIPNELLNDRERYYINKYKTFINGYNASSGGEGSCKVSLEEEDVILKEYLNGLTIQELSNKYNYHQTTIRRVLSNQGLSEEEIQRLACIIRGKNHQKRVVGYDLLCKKVKEYNSLTDAANEFNNNLSTLSKIISRHTYANDAFWFYEKDYSEEEIKNIIYSEISKSNNRAVYNKNLLIPFRNANYAAEYFNLTRRDILLSCQKNLQTKRNKELKFDFYDKVFYNMINDG